MVLTAVIIGVVTIPRCIIIIRIRLRKRAICSVIKRDIGLRRTSRKGATRKFMHGNMVLLCMKGNNQQAVEYFQKEADQWPESRVFMAKLIHTLANNRAKNQKETIKNIG